MYSLPITTYSDYWRATKVWSSYLGGLAMFAAGTRYSTMSTPDINQNLQFPTQLAIQPSNSEELGIELSSLEFRERALNQGLISRGLSMTVSRGAFTPSTVGPKITGEEANNQTVNEQEANERAADEQTADRQMTGEQAPDDRAADEQQGPEQSAISQETSGREPEDEVTIKTHVEEKEIPYETQYIESDQLLPGMSKIQAEGEKGILRQVVKTFEVDGQPIDQQVKTTLELKRPKKKVVIRNSKPVQREEFNLEQMKISQTLNVEATAYTYTGNKTATGLVTREGLIAVDPRVIALGSKVYVEGYGYAIAADTGGDIQGQRIDVFFSTLRQCIDWGRRPVHIYVLRSI